MRIGRWMVVVLGLIWGVMGNLGEVVAGEKWLTVVIPVRPRIMWKDSSIESLTKLIGVLERQKVRATWLVADDVWKDGEVIGELGRRRVMGDEIGLWLEVYGTTAERAGVEYLVNTPWYKPGVVFLSGYGREERRALIEMMVRDYENVWGEAPRSAGAWWIDSWSMAKLANVGVKTAMIVAEQEGTDGYTVGGQWVGLPYLASKKNILKPATVTDNLGVTIIQWAMRDPIEAFGGEGAEFSNFSVQANDYRQKGLGIDYFEKVAGHYLNDNDWGQLTIGLEAGMESVGNEGEMERQIERVKGMGAVAATMSQFGEWYEKKYPSIGELKIGDEGQGWVMSKAGRRNEKLGKEIDYIKVGYESDNWVADKSERLERKLEEKRLGRWWSRENWWLGMVIIWTGWKLRRKEGRKMWLAVGWGWLALGLVFRSGMYDGWRVYFGPVAEPIWLTKILAVVITALVAEKWRGKWWWLWVGASSWWLWEIPKATIRNGWWWIGVLAERVRMIGLEWQEGSLRWVDEVTTPVVAKSMWQWRWEEWWNRGWVVLAVWVTVGLLLAIVGKRTVQKVGGAGKVFIYALGWVMIIGQAWWIVSVDPWLIK